MSSLWPHSILNYIQLNMLLKDNFIQNGLLVNWRHSCLRGDKCCISSCRGCDDESYRVIGFVYHSYIMVMDFVYHCCIN